MARMGALTMDKPATINALANILQENLGNRITVALANGILQVLEQEIAKADSIREAVASGKYGSFDGVVVKGTPDNQVPMP